MGPKAECQIEIKDEISIVVHSSAEVESVASSVSSESESLSNNASAEEDEAHEEVVPPRKFRRVSGPEAEGASWLFHKRSGILHLCDPVVDSSNWCQKYCRCGRVVGNNYCHMTDKESGNPMGIICNPRS